MGNTNIIDNNETWDYSHFMDCPVNPMIDSSNSTFYGKEIIKSKEKHPYTQYIGYCWIYLCTRDDKWKTAGLFPITKFKKLLHADPIYQIPNNSDHLLSELCKQVIYDTYSLYQIMCGKSGVGVSVVDLVPFRYKLTAEEQENNNKKLHKSLKGISENLDILVKIRDECYNDDNHMPFFCKQDKDAFDKSIKFMKQYKEINTLLEKDDNISEENGVSQELFKKCVQIRKIKGEDPTKIDSAMDFMKRPASEQKKLCEERNVEARNYINKIIKSEGWPCYFGTLNKAHQMYFNKYKPLFGCDRIGITAAPDTYSYVYMETALLQVDTMKFLDKYGYSNQNTKEWKSLDSLVEELRRLVNIYNDTT